MENFVHISWGSLALLYPREPGEPGAHSDLEEHSGGVRAPGPNPAPALAPWAPEWEILQGTTLRLGKVQKLARE